MFKVIDMKMNRIDVPTMKAAEISSHTLPSYKPNPIPQMQVSFPSLQIPLSLQVVFVMAPIGQEPSFSVLGVSTGSIMNLAKQRKPMRARKEKIKYWWSNFLALSCNFCLAYGSFTLTREPSEYGQTPNPVQPWLAAIIHVLALLWMCDVQAITAGKNTRSCHQMFPKPIEQITTSSTKVTPPQVFLNFSMRCRDGFETFCLRTVFEGFLDHFDIELLGISSWFSTSSSNLTVLATGMSAILLCRIPG
mmetsp:Transcript_24038/g.50111  ORF Transcript_24038/g.50111 Transcript_24038/m.50111 type:complete len:248 (+) Transcript_24038:623-1366(+)